MKRPQKLAVMLVPTPPYEICGLTFYDNLMDMRGTKKLGHRKPYWHFERLAIVSAVAIGSVYVWWEHNNSARPTSAPSAPGSTEEKEESPSPTSLSTDIGFEDVLLELQVMPSSKSGPIVEPSDLSPEVQNGTSQGIP